MCRKIDVCSHLFSNLLVEVDVAVIFQLAGFSGSPDVVDCLPANRQTHANQPTMSKVVNRLTANKGDKIQRTKGQETTQEPLARNAQVLRRCHNVHRTLNLSARKHKTHKMQNLPSVVIRTLQYIADLLHLASCRSCTKMPVPCQTPPKWPLCLHRIILSQICRDLAVATALIRPCSTALHTHQV